MWHIACVTWVHKLIWQWVIKGFLCIFLHATAWLNVLWLLFSVSSCDTLLCLLALTIRFEVNKHSTDFGQRWRITLHWFATRKHTQLQQLLHKIRKKNRGELCAQLWKNIHFHNTYLCLQTSIIHTSRVSASFHLSNSNRTDSKQAGLGNRCENTITFYRHCQWHGHTYTHIVHMYFHFLFLNHSDIWSRIAV